MFYGVYSGVRDINGDKPVSVSRAATNAHRVISWERFVHLFDEAQIQRWFLGDHVFIRLWDAYYGTAHFIAVVGVLLYLFFRQPGHYRLWRNTLAILTGLALVGFQYFPLLPPRLLPSSYHFVDTLKVVGGFWDFSSGPIEALSNQYAAMPSLHTGWSLWCALALGALIRPRWGKALLLIYPLATIFCIVITGNHYFADAVGGVITVAVAYGGARLVTPRLARLTIGRRDPAIG